MWFVRTQKALYLTLLYKFALRMLLRPRMLDLIKYNIYIGLTSLSESPFQSHQYYDTILATLTKTHAWDMVVFNVTYLDPMQLVPTSMS